jgi:hypothetical protein
VGRLCTSQDSIEQAFVGFYTDLFAMVGATNIVNCIRAITCKVTPEMNTQLEVTFTAKEVHQALIQMAPLKAQGPDKFSADFYKKKKNGQTVGPELCNATLHFLNYLKMDASINETYIALIPKKKKALAVFLILGLLASVLANNLKRVLPFVISENQNAFIPSRLITDNVLAAYETLHSMHTQMWSKVGFMGIKLDMSKAYDRVEWAFLKAIMGQMDFYARWIDLIIGCVRTVTYAILVNSQPVGSIKPTHSIRKGDPLSSYLFLLCAEGLSSLLSLAKAKGTITRVPISKSQPRLSHLFFAYDSLLFCKQIQ